MLLTNYFNSTWRNILNHKLFSAINVIGLAIGLAACMLIALFVRDELSYDKFWTKADTIYRTHATYNYPGRDPSHWVLTSGRTYQPFKQYFPEVEYAARITPKEPALILDGEYFVERIAIVDPDFINIFDITTLAGDVKAALADSSSLVLNQTLARKYFGDENPIGRIVTLDFDVYERDYKIAAIIEDLPENSQIQLAGFIPIIEEDWVKIGYMFENWSSVNFQLYFSVKEGTDIESINSRMPQFIDSSFPDFGNNPRSESLTLENMSVKDLHLLAEGNGDWRPRGNMSVVVTFSAIAVLILFIASINFMNLSTARASQRAKEVSLRKVMGASRKNLVTQFIGESILLTLFALLLALTIVEIILPIYGNALGKEFAINYLSTDLLSIIALAVGVGVIGGLYPAFILSNFRPAEILKANKSSETRTSVKLRAALVVIQFSVAIILFVSTSVVYGQMMYAVNIDLGYNKENLLVVNEVRREAAASKLPVLLNEIRRTPNVEYASFSRTAPGYTNSNSTTLRSEDMSYAEAPVVTSRGAGYDYFKTYDIEMLAGREYSREFNDVSATSDDIRAGRGYPSSIIINEAAVRRFGYDSPDDALGKMLYSNIGSNDEIVEAEYRIIGVSANIHFDSLKKTIVPAVFPMESEMIRAISIRYNGDPVAVLEQVKAIWQREVPTVPFSYDFATDVVAEHYETEAGQAFMFAAFSGLAILIASLGLYGLASFTAQRRTKEIGIRKVMGATVIDIVKLLVWQFSKPVLIANLIAWPLSYYAMTTWLESFVYRIEGFMIIGFCLMAGISALLIAWGTVASNSISVARTNPIKALRYE
tara:strand:+ start:12611 stop:15082 length:2472 start_codon:yes stop_codon:yes gene_type:complete